MTAINPLSELLSRALDGAALRQAVHTSNIANAGVGDFRRLEVSFDTALTAASAALGVDPGTASESLSAPRVVETNQTVRLDQEMALMAKDAIQYQALLNAADRSFGLLRLAIREGKEG